MLARQFAPSRRRGSATARAQALRASFEALGPAYVKFGQIVGSSPGAFGQEVSDEFRSCLDTGPAVPGAVVRARIEAAFGRPVDDLFARFDDLPLACASIAVVHRATLPDGTPVVVKVLRPRIAERVALDVDIMEPLFRWLALRGIGPAGPFYRFVRGFRSQIAEELDLRNEARTMAHFSELFAEAGLHRIVVPRPIDGMVARHVLVMEFLDGVAIDDIAGVGRLGHDPEPLVADLLRSWFLTGLRDGIFHGDIHAGNLMLLTDGRIGVIDWGIVAHLDGDTRSLFRRFAEGVLGDDSAWVEIGAFIRSMVGGDEGGDGRRIDPTRIRDLVTKPFGEVDLTGVFRGPRRAPGGESRRAHRRRLARFRRRLFDEGIVDGSVVQANFMLFKQLLYFERYGKMYLADQALMGDREWLAEALAQAPR